jgi:hypothetical protein
MTCKHTYLSSVLSFTKKESARLNLDDIQQLTESFAAHHADPMGVDAIAGCAYLHVEGGRYDVHMVQAQLDLESGRRVDLYLDTCGDTKRIADWQDCKNHEMKLDDPRDPSRQRLTNDKVRESSDREEIRKLVNNHLEQQVITGALSSRADVIRELQSCGFKIMRQNKKTISIKSPDLSQNIRLKGEMFHELFRGIKGIRSAVEAGQRRSEEDYRQQYETARTRLAESNQKRTTRISEKLKIDLAARSQRAPQGHSPNAMADLDSIGHKLSAARRNRVLGSAESQHTNPDGDAGELPNAAISGQPVCHRPQSQRTHPSERKLLDKTQIKGSHHESTVDKIPNYHAHGEKTECHAKTMRGLSISSHGIEQASQRFGHLGESGGSAFDRARRKTYAAIERLTGFIEYFELKLTRLFSRCAGE